MIKDNFQYTQDNYGEAYKAAAKQGKPIVAIFGSFENNNTRGLIQNSLPQSQAAKDAIRIYIDPTKCKDQALLQFANGQLAGGHNAAVSIVFTVKPGKDGMPEPEAYTYRWQGADKSMLSSFDQALNQAQAKMTTYVGHYKLGDSETPVAKPSTEQAPQPQVTHRDKGQATAQPTTEQRPRGDSKPGPNGAVQPVETKPGPSESAKPGETKSGKPGDLPDLQIGDKAKEERFTYEQFKRLDKAQQLFDGDEKNPGYDKTRDKLTEDLQKFEKLVKDSHGIIDENNKGQAINLLYDASKQLEQEQRILSKCQELVKGIPNGNPRADELKQKLEKDEASVKESTRKFETLVKEHEAAKRQAQEDDRKMEVEAQKQANLALEKANLKAAIDSINQARHDFAQAQLQSQKLELSQRTNRSSPDRRNGRGEKCIS